MLAPDPLLSTLAAEGLELDPPQSGDRRCSDNPETEESRRGDRPHLVVVGIIGHRRRLAEVRQRYGVSLLWCD